MKKILTILFVTIALANLPAQQIIPKPNTIHNKSGKPFELKNNYAVYYSNDSIVKEINFLTDYLKELTGFDHTINAISGDGKLSQNTNIVIFLKDKDMASEAYELDIDESKILIRAGNGAGIFYGIQSLMQMLPSQKSDKPIRFSSMKIIDKPRFEWRGMHLDVCRHFFPTAFIKRYIDFLATYKMNVFHWHLTEDQGWRIAIRKYTKLTDVGSIRKGSMVGPYADHNIDSVRYGGYYSQEEIKDIVDYAAKRHITIVPEIEMPGHALAALAAYPELSCTGGPFEVGKQWGVFDDVFCAGNDKTFEFLENVLDEVCEMFPGKYIHIGGDECPKTRWQNCPKCQKRMKENNLANEHELQSYFIQRIEKYLNAKGKQIIGWDEILEGGLAPNAAVMSWRGTEGGIAAAKQKHNVVMTPGSHCYFDHYQGNPHNEPHAIGGFTPLEKVYSYDPIPAELSADERKYILGAQGNVWTEYINAPSQVEYMAIPRMCALAEVLWTNTEKKNERDFFKRLSNHLDYLDKKQVNYALSFIEPKIILSRAAKGIDVTLVKPNVDGSIFYNVKPAGVKPKHKHNLIVKSPDEKTVLHIENSCGVSTYFEMKDSSNAYIKWNRVDLKISKSTAKKITYNNPPNPAYNTDADFTLVNGVQATLPRVNSEWLAWSGEDVEMIIDFGKSEKISELNLGYLVDNGNWIYAPGEFVLFTAKDGINFKALKQDPAKTSKIDKDIKDGTIVRHTIKTKKTSTRYVKIKIKNPGKIPAGKPGEGKNSWLFFDEIQIN